MRLPRELRDMIWDMAAPEDIHVVKRFGRINFKQCCGYPEIRLRCFEYLNGSSWDDWMLIALPLACRQIYVETLAVWGKRKKLILDDVETLVKLRESLPSDVWASMRDIHFNVTLYDFVRIPQLAAELDTLDELHSLVITLPTQPRQKAEAFTPLLSFAQIRHVPQTFTIHASSNNYPAVQGMLDRSNVRPLPFQLNTWRIYRTGRVCTCSVL
ncbi:hypothetical protein MPH_12662 [Macrophomina phaseolina MS6]|uniref:DUF7730 domain-containing protein n=1 Tax=Macrophomina phaseolina (strain MS6) TaxID=1126212 RepID=K2S0M2_MACPH|nr:hypothetical protein MPH_12662 [Macrophomina phaseolina MS6]